MDQDWRPQNDEKVGSDVQRRIKEFIVTDNRQEFVSFIKSQLQKAPDINSSKICPSKLLKWICCYHGVGCAEALVQGQTGLHVDLNVALEDGMFPLHHASLSLSPNLVKLFIDNGAQVDQRCNAVGLRYHGLRPLDVAMDTLSYHVEWTPKESIFKLVIALCQIEMKEPLKAIELLANNTKEIEHVFFHCAKEGKLIELGALLMVAEEKVIPSTVSNHKFSKITLRQCIATEIALLIHEEYKLLGNKSKKLVQLCKEKKGMMMSVMLLIEVFERSSFQIAGHVGILHPKSVVPERVPREISSLLRTTGFAVKQEDTNLKIEDCFSTQLLSERLDVLRGWRSKPRDIYLPNLQPLCLYNRRKSITRMQFEQQKRSVSTCFSCEKQGLSSAVRPFPTLQTFTCNGSEVSTSVKASVKKTILNQQHMPNYSLRKLMSSFVYAINSSIRHI